MDGGNESQKPARPKFIPYSTMFKIESRPRPRIILDVKGRLLQCVACKNLLEWRIYSIALEKFDNQCPLCHAKARDFWKGKSHKELDPDA